LYGVAGTWMFADFYARKGLNVLDW
jgi:hypothetical protein